MIDIHSHILPDVDDGASSFDITLEMLRNAEKDGTTKIIATPHFCRGYAEVEFSKIKEIYNQVNNVVKQKKINIEIKCGQEIFYSENILEDYKNNTIGTLADSNYILFELPLQGNFERDILDNLYELQLIGLKPILAHPERYEFLKEKPMLINELIDEGVLFQVNSGSIEGIFGKKVQKVSEIFLKNGIYNFIGSDAHNTRTRVTGVKKGVNLSISKNKIYKNLFEESAELLLQNDKVKFYGEKVEKSIFCIFR